MTAKRDAYIDIAKGICMLLIICIHAEVFGVIGMPLTFIAVPMFFFMSGFYDRSEKAFNSWLIKSLRTLILPAVVWTIVGRGYGMVLKYIKSGGVEPWNLNIYEPTEGNGPAWFLFSLLAVKVLTWLLLRLRLSGWKLVLGSVLVGYGGYHCNLPFCIDEGLVALPLYVIGKCIYPYIGRIVVNRRLALSSLVFVCVYILGYVQYVIVPVGGGSGFRPFYLVALSVILLCFPSVLYISKSIENKVCARSIEKFGGNSLGVMLLHAPMCHTAAVVLNRVFDVGSTIWVVMFLLAYVIIVLMSYWLTVLINHYCPILLGKRVVKAA